MSHVQHQVRCMLPFHLSAEVVSKLSQFLSLHWPNNSSDNASFAYSIPLMSEFFTVLYFINI